MDCAYSVPAYRIEQTRTEYQDTYKQFWGTTTHIRRTKRCDPYKVLGKIYTQATELGLSVNTYLITLFSWIENGHLKYKPGCLYFCGSVAARDICKEQMEHIRVRYAGHTPPRVAQPIVLQIVHEIRQTAKDIDKLRAANQAVSPSVVVALNVNRLSPYYWAVYEQDWLSYRNLATADTQQKVQEVVNYLRGTGIYPEVMRLLAA